MPPLVTKVNNKRKTKKTEKNVRKRKKLTVKTHALSDVESNTFDIVGNLPPELVQTIFTELSPADLRNALGTCRKWKNLASHDYFWKLKCKMDNYLEMNETSQNEVYEKFVNKSENYWQRVYVYNEALHQNWRNYVFEETILDFPICNLRIHYFDDEILVMTNHTKWIFVYNYCIEKFLQIFPMLRSGNITQIMIEKTLTYIVYCHKQDRLLIVWSISNGLCLLSTTFSLEYAIQSITIYKNLIAVLFCNGVCCIVNILSRKVEYKTEIEDINCTVCFYNDQVAFGTRTGVINVMNWPNKAITLTIIYDGEVIIYRVMISSDYLFTFSSVDICVWSLQNKTRLSVIVQSEDFKISPDSFFLNSNTFLVKNVSQNRLEAWDFINGIRKFIIITDSSNISIVSAVMNDHYIITYGYTERNKPDKLDMWCKKTGKFITKINLDCTFSQLLVTNTKFTFLKLGYYSSLYIQDFAKNIKLRQLNSLFT